MIELELNAFQSKGGPDEFRICTVTRTTGNNNRRQGVRAYVKIKNIFSNIFETTRFWGEKFCRLITWDILHIIIKLEAIKMNKSRVVSEKKTPKQFGPIAIWPNSNFAQ